MPPFGRSTPLGVPAWQTWWPRPYQRGAFIPRCVLGRMDRRAGHPAPPRPGHRRRLRPGAAPRGRPACALHPRTRRGCRPPRCSRLGHQASLGPTPSGPPCPLATATRIRAEPMAPRLATPRSSRCHYILPRARGVPAHDTGDSCFGSLPIRPGCRGLAHRHPDGASYHTGTPPHGHRPPVPPPAPPAAHNSQVWTSAKYSRLWPPRRSVGRPPGRLPSNRRSSSPRTPHGAGLDQNLP